jgi:hypothetical protein
MAMPLSIAEIAYQYILDSFVDLDHVTSSMDEEDPILRPVWATSSPCSHDFLDENFLSNESILKSMNGSERPWNDMHHRSYFLPSLERIEQDDFQSTLSEIVSHAIVPLNTHANYAEGNMASISPTISIDISRTSVKIENVNLIVRQKKLCSTPKSSNNFDMYSLGHMKRCQGSTPVLSNMRLGLIQKLNLFDNILEL